MSSPAPRAPEATELVRGVLAAKPEAFHVFFETWLPLVLRFSRQRTPSEAAAQELTRRVLRRALVELPTWTPARDLGAWMRAVAELVVREEQP